VTSMEKNVRISKLTQEHNEASNPNTHAYFEFVEKEIYEEAKPWGDWVIDDGAPVTITETRFSQNIVFIQAEDIDGAPTS